MAKLDIGSTPHDFTLPSDGGGTITLSELRGQPVVLYFYPKDDTSGCTQEAIEFSGLKPQFDKLGVKVIGMSPDPVKKHDKFKNKHGLKVDLVADEDKAITEAYGLWVEKSMYGRKYMGVERTTYLIDKAGKIARIWNKVKVPGHAAEVLEATAALGG
ncbi:peroxiredoxin [Phyllobacterium endophyticum]|uniref:thioredoxin-dependent peroxiredoxin n=1 Tax=Phyllobacterium endophyticum TaxID=1149773 RepID=A0A2P7AW31_9HYPH|nr:peroxiredoxin [Phyllobacterium endophyticum]MBB3235014.1 peroxiredoxin Q/BCP [Phyllobacterium endophyticum]PSH58422.1 peroxiredoxin [Phyllobacterium endophyticum]TYR39094.1 peroxiredoxin [Phyllobacterium endophyticum]